MTKSIQEIKSHVSTMLKQSPPFGTERFPGAANDYIQISPNIISAIMTMNAQTDESQEHNNSYRLYILKLVSLECAAGASAQRCRAWFQCLAELASCSLSDSFAPIDPVEAVTYFALAGNFSKAMYDKWPDDLDTKQIPDRIIYMMMTGKQLDISASAKLYDNQYWLNLYDSINHKDEAGAQAAFISIAEWWLSEYRDSEVPFYDPQSYPYFEPIPNAALALAKLRESMNIGFDSEEQRQFYVAALI